METKFKSFVESFYLLLEDNDYVKAREQVNIMKAWCAAYLESLDGLDNIPDNQQIRDNCTLFQQMTNHCNKRLCDAIFKAYSSSISSLKPFPSNFWEICQQNELESTVISYFNMDGFQQERTLVENVSRREMAVSFSSSQVGICRIDLSGFISDDLSKFCEIADYIYGVIVLCKASPFSSSLQLFISNSIELISTTFHHFDICIHSLRDAPICDDLQSKWESNIKSILKECSQGSSEMTLPISDEDLTSVNHILLLQTTLIHHLQLYLPLFTSASSFSSIIDNYPSLEAFVSQVYIYLIMHDCFQSNSYLSPAIIEDIMGIIKESMQRQHLTGHSIELHSLFSQFVFPFITTKLSHVQSLEGDSEWLGVRTSLMMSFDGICLLYQYIEEIKQSIPSFESEEETIQSQIHSLEDVIITGIQPHIYAMVIKEWEPESYELSPEEYDELILEPVQYPSISELATSSLLTESGKKHLSAVLVKVYCQAIHSILILKKFTECGGLLLKHRIRGLQDALINSFGDEVIGYMELKKLQLFSYIVSIPKDVLDVSALCTNAGMELSEKEKTEILSLRC